MLPRSSVSSSAAALAALLALSACGSEDDRAADRAPRVPRIEAREYSYVLPAKIEGGVTSIEFANTGKEMHEFALGRLAPGATLAQFRRELTDGDDQAPGEDVARDVGGVPQLSPGRRVTVTRKLEPGTYVLLCYVPGPDGKPHIDYGMLGSFEVAGDSNHAPPKPDAVIVAGDKRFKVPKLNAGRQTIELRNAATREREFQLGSPEPGKTLPDVERWFDEGMRGPAPIVFPGGIQSIPAGSSVYQELELEAGRTYYLDDEHGLEARFTVFR
jgi:hypothetical protein